MPRGKQLMMIIFLRKKNKRNPEGASRERHVTAVGHTTWRAPRAPKVTPEGPSQGVT